MLETERLLLVEATPDDIEDVIALEHNPEHSIFLYMGSYDDHLKEINEENTGLYVIKTKDNKTIGYFLFEVNFEHRVFELRRIAINPKRQGFAREVFERLFKYAFEELDLNRFWLDVFPDHEVGIKLYEGLGMHRDGVLRQNFKIERGYMDQVVYSLLKAEYFNKK